MKSIHLVIITSVRLNDLFNSPFLFIFIFIFPITKAFYFALWAIYIQIHLFI